MESRKQDRGQSVLPKESEVASGRNSTGNIMKAGILIAVAVAAVAVTGAVLPRQLTTSNSIQCPGYVAENVSTTPTGLTAVLSLAGEACNVYGNDIRSLRLTVNHDTASRLHVKIEDVAGIAYQVPESNFARPDSSRSKSEASADLAFKYETSPFSFMVIRKSNGDVLFDSSAESLIFEDQYIRLRTSLPADPNLYGIGEHSDGFRLNTTDYTRTLWARDSYGVPSGTNLYGSHPVYFDHRGENGTHAVFLLSSSGMDVKINNTAESGQYLEYNVLGGVIDLYFLAGPDPVAVSQQYAETVGKPAMPPYWGFGLHQCRYGYRDYLGVAEVVYNYSKAGIPLETMWTDIDYMYQRYIMTTDPDRFPVERMRELVDYLHQHDQHYIVMVDPAIAYQEDRENNLPYDTFRRARDEGLFLQKNESIFAGVVWPGVAAFPDWFHPDTQKYWTDEFATFFSAEDGVDIDGLWIDMNEAANFNYFGSNPQETAEERGFPPTRPALRSSPRQIPGFPAAFQPNASSPYPPDSLGYSPPWLSPDAAPNTKRSAGEAEKLQRRQSAGGRNNETRNTIGYPRRDLLASPYQINNENSIDAFGGLSNFTVDTDIIHYDGHAELDVHNLYGSMMSIASQKAMEARRPGRRTLVITRSSFAGDGRAVAKWLGDNLSSWEQYRQSVQGMLDFAALFQMPMVGSDVCGFGLNTTETLCARWATLGAFNPFYRNHNGDSSLPQEFYVWDTVTQAAKNAIDIRYRLLDYIYTAFHQQHETGTPALLPMFFMYPNDTKTFGLEWQFFYGPSLLISPVTEENSTSVDVYLPDDLFYDFQTYSPVQGNGSMVTLSDVDFTEIPIHIKSDSIIALRSRSGMTTSEVRQQAFTLLIAPNTNGEASGELYLDDGDSLVQAETSEIVMTFAANVLHVGGCFGYTAEEPSVHSVTLLGVQAEPTCNPRVCRNDACLEINDDRWHYDAERSSIEVMITLDLDSEFSLIF